MSEIEFRNAWKQNDQRQRDDALAIWKEHNVLPVDEKPGRRLAELCSVAYLEDEAIGVATAAIQDYKRLRSNIAFARCFVTPGNRQQDAARGLMIACKEYIQAWAKENPDEDVRGMAVVSQSPDLAPINRIPVWPNTKLALIGFNEAGHQIRVTWFDHVFLPAKME
jgi:hypothetical protein